MNVSVTLNKGLEQLLTQKEKSLFSYKGEMEFIEFICILEQRNHIGDVLAIIRRSLRLSLREFSTLIGVSHAYLHSLEHHEQRRPGARETASPSIAITCNIADRLDIPRLRFMWMFTKEMYELRKEQAEEAQRLPSRA